MRFTVSVTVPAFSSVLAVADEKAKVLSLFWMVTVMISVPSVAPDGPNNVILNHLSAATAPLLRIGTVIVLLVSPGTNVKVPLPAV